MRSPAFTLRSYAVLANLSIRYPPRQGTFRCVTHPFAARRQGCPRAAARLACVKHSASVQSEPGSNSSVQSLFYSHSNDYQRSNSTSVSRSLRPTITVFSCKCLLLLFSFGSSATPAPSTSSRKLPALRSSLRLAAVSQPPQNSNPAGSFDLRSSPTTPPAQQTPTPIGCSIVKELAHQALFCISREAELYGLLRFV